MRRLGEYLGLTTEDGEWAKPDYRLLAVLVAAVMIAAALDAPFWGIGVVVVLVSLGWGLVTTAGRHT